MVRLFGILYVLKSRSFVAPTHQKKLSQFLKRPIAKFAGLGLGWSFMTFECLATTGFEDRVTSCHFCSFLRDWGIQFSQTIVKFWNLQSCNVAFVPLAKQQFFLAVYHALLSLKFANDIEWIARIKDLHLKSFSRHLNQLSFPKNIYLKTGISCRSFICRYSWGIADGLYWKSRSYQVGYFIQDDKQSLQHLNASLPNWKSWNCWFESLRGVQTYLRWNEAFALLSTDRAVKV